VKSPSVTVEGDFYLMELCGSIYKIKGGRNLTGPTSYFPVHIFL
jgi:hypothetical protein